MAATRSNVYRRVSNAVSRNAWSSRNVFPMPAEPAIEPMLGDVLACSSPRSQVCNVRSVSTRPTKVLFVCSTIHLLFVGGSNQFSSCHGRLRK